MPTYTVGPGKTYSTITAALAAIPSNITGTGAHQVVVDAGTYNEGSVLTLPRPTGSDANNYVEVMAAAGSEHKGNPASGVIIRNTTGSFFAAIRIRPSSRLTNLVISVSSGANQTPGLGHVSGELSPTNIPTICKNIIVLQSSGAPAYAIGNSSPVYLYNCISINVNLFNLTGFSFQGDAFIKHKIYNCGAYNFKDGFTDNGNTEIKNSWSWKFNGSSGSDFAGFLTNSTSNNASSDSTAPGLSSLINVTATQFGFILPSGNNFHITSASILANAGINLSAIFTTDIDNESITDWSIGPDSIPGSAQAPTTSSSPAKKNENRNRPTPDAKPPGLRLQYSISVAQSNRARAEKDASAPNIHSQRGEPSNGFNHNQNQSAPGEPSGGNANRGHPNGYISVTPNLGAYTGTVIDGKGMRLYADKENLQVGAQYRDLDLVGNGRGINNRAHLPNLPQGQFTFTPRSNDILAPLMAHFQLRTGSALAGGTTYYEFTPSLRSPSTFGSSFGTGTYGLSGDMFTVNVTKLVNGSAIRFNQGVCDTLVWDFKANEDFSLTSEYRFKSVSLIGSSSAGSTGSYSTLPSFSGFNSSIDFMGVAPVDFKLTLKNKVSDYKPAGGTYSYYKFTDYFVEGNATIDLSKVSLAYLGSMLGTQSFSISGTLSNSLADRIIFQIPNCRMNDFDLKLGENTINIPFRAYEPDSFSAPVKVMVWTQHYSATTFEPN